MKQNHTENKHHHRGRSSESLLEKEKILSVLAIESGQTVLDAGCGNGYMAIEFAKKIGPAGKVYALDPDPLVIDRLTEKLQGTLICPLVGDITKPTRLAASAFDLIYLSNVLHCFSMEQMARFAAEAERLLKPGGTLAIVEIVKAETPFGPPLQVRLSPDELTEALDFLPVSLVDVGQYFYLQTFRKQKTENEPGERRS